MRYFGGILIFVESPSRRPEIFIAIFYQLLGAIINLLESRKVHLEVVRALLRLRPGLSHSGPIPLEQLNAAFLRTGKPLGFSLLAAISFGSLVWVQGTDVKSMKRFSMFFEQIWGKF